jgi:hypothetical protein
MEQIGTMDSGDPDLDTLVGTFVAVKMSQPAVESLEHLIDQLLSEDDGGTVVADHLHGQRHPSVGELWTVKMEK